MCKQCNGHLAVVHTCTLTQQSVASVLSRSLAASRRMSTERRENTEEELMKKSKVLEERIQELEGRLRSQKGRSSGCCGRRKQ